VKGECTHTTMTKQLMRSGVENSRDMNMPLSSKYCWLENNLQTAGACWQ